MQANHELTEFEFRRMLEAQVPRLRRRLGFLFRGYVRRRSSDIVEDALQEAIVVLLREGPAALGWWQTRRAPVEQAILLLGERAARSYLRSGRRSGQAEIPTCGEELAVRFAPDPEAQLLARRDLARMIAGLRSRFGDRAELVLAAWLEGDRSSEACEQLKLTRNALYCLKQRMKSSIEVRAVGRIRTREATELGSSKRT